MQIISIKDNKIFLKAYKQGRSFISKNLVLYIVRNKLPYSRLGITTSKKIGTAVKRSRARRIIKEGFRSHHKSINPGYDFVFVARGKTVFLKSTDMVTDIKEKLKKANVLKTKKVDLESDKKCDDKSSAFLSE